jgi:hypothetical protein
VTLALLAWQRESHRTVVSPVRDAAIDTTFDTAQSAIPRNSRQPRAKIRPYLSRFCNIQQPSETGVGGLWLRRSQAQPLMVSPLKNPRFAEQDGSKDNSQVFISAIWRTV